MLNEVSRRLSNKIIEIATKLVELFCQNFSEAEISFFVIKKKKQSREKTVPAFAVHVRPFQPFSSLSQTTYTFTLHPNQLLFIFEHEKSLSMRMLQF